MSRNFLPTRWSPSAAIVPNAVARMAFGIAIRKQLRRAFWTTLSLSATSNQRSVKPPQRFVDVEVSLKAKITTMTIGR